MSPMTGSFGVTVTVAYIILAITLAGFGTSDQTLQFATALMTATPGTTSRTVATVSRVLR